MKKLTLLSLCALSTVALAQEECMECKVVDTSLTQEQSSVLSKEKGAILQGFEFKNNLEETQVDKAQLVKNVKSTENYFADFFKQYPDYKGTFVVLYSVIPVVEGEPQIDSNNPVGKEIYEEAKKHILCEKSLCSSEILIPANFSDRLVYPSLLMELKKYTEENEFNKKIDSPVVLKNTNYTAPVSYFLFFSTNGAHTTQDMKKKFLGN